MFRACMLPVLVPSLGEGWSILMCPLLFGVGEFYGKVCHQYHRVALHVSVTVVIVNGTLLEPGTSFQSSYHSCISLWVCFKFD